MTQVSAKGSVFTGQWEGFRSCPYQDSVGVWTIGYGTTSASGHSVGPNHRCISQETAHRWLREVLNRQIVPAIPKRRIMRQREIDALADFGYNLGPGALSDASFSTLAKRLHSVWALSYRHRKRIYRDELPKWDVAGGEHLSGLAARRRSEVALACRGDYDSR